MTGSATRRNRLLRHRIIKALKNLGRLDARRLAALAYRRREARCGQATPSQLVCTRRALRRLHAKGAVISVGRYRRRKLYRLRRDADLLAEITLGDHL